MGFYFGLCSIACWIVAQFPQLITNYRRKSADALSPFFLAEWLLGDTCNLVGALLQGNQPETVILTAQYFICMDCVLLIQYLYYTAVSRRVERTYALARRRRHHHHGGGGGGHHHHGGGPGTADAAGNETIHRGHHNHHNNQQRLQRVVDQLRNRGPIEDSSITPNNESEAQFLGLQPEINSSSVVGAVVVAEPPSQSAVGGSSSRRKVGSTLVAGVATIAVGSVLLLQGPASSAAVLASIRSTSMSKPETQNMQNTHSRSLSSFSLFEQPIGILNNENLVGKQKWEQTTGSVLGYISCALYLTSRISQIIKNARRRSAEGLAASMFLCAVAANIFYGVGVLLRSRTRDELLASLPWVLGSLGTVGLDMIILIQTVMFGQGRKTRDEEEPLLGGGDSGGEGGLTLAVGGGRS